MKRALILSLVIALTVFAFAGYAADNAKKAKGEKKGAANQEQIQKLLDKWKEAGLAKDIEKAMPLFSDKFKSAEYGDKAGLKTFLQDAFSAGYLKDMEIDMAKAKTTIDNKKGTALVGPITMTARFGTATIDLELAKEGANWLVTGMTVKQN